MSTVPSAASRATVSAPSNIALIKYWGAKDLQRAIPANPSISMTLSVCRTRTTVEHRPEGGEDQIWLRHGEEGLSPAPEAFATRARQHLERLRQWAGVAGSFRVATENTFPAAAGIASSASGFAALTCSVLAALRREVPSDQLSALARSSGSGSASRSVLGGFVEWPFAEEGTCHAEAIAAADHWQLWDLVAVVDSGPKSVSSLDGHQRAGSSPYWPARQAALGRRLEVVRRAIQERDFATLAPVVEAEAIDLHCVAMSSDPPIFYWKPGTLAVLERVRELRASGLDACSTMDAGANVHVLSTASSADEVARALGELPEVTALIRDRVGEGPRREEESLL